MLESLKNIYRRIKYTFFITREKEYLKFHKKRRRGLIQDYIEKHDVKKLQIGAQSNSIPGWLNVDIHPKELTVAYLDATETFPLADETFDYVFSEHMIEHIKFAEGLFMLKECYRVLKTGGKIRIATPNLHAVVKVLQHESSPVHQEYIGFYLNKFCAPGLPKDPVYVVNTMFYEFGHQFIHTDKSLMYGLSNAGFTNIEFCAVGKSNDAHLNGIEQHAVEIGSQNNLLETIVVEAVK